MPVSREMSDKLWQLVAMEHGLHALREMATKMTPPLDHRANHPANSAMLLSGDVHDLSVELNRHAKTDPVTGDALVDHVLETFTPTKGEPYFYPFAWRAIQLTRWIESHPGELIAVVRHQINELSGRYVVTRTIQLGQLDGSTVGPWTLPTGPHQRIILPLSDPGDEGSPSTDLWLADDEHTNPLQGLDRPFVIDEDHVVTFGIQEGVPLYHLQILYGEELTKWLVEQDYIDLFATLHDRLKTQLAKAA